MPLPVAALDVERAGAKLKDPLKNDDRPPQAAGAGERPIELYALLQGRAGEFNSGILLVSRDLQVGECLVVFEIRIKPWLHILDEPAFQK